MTRYDLSDSRLSVVNLCLRQFACYCDSDGKKTPGNCYSVSSGSILAYGVLDAGYRYDLTDKEASVLGRRSIYHTTFRDAGFEGTYYHLKISNIVGFNYSRETILTAKMNRI